LTLCFRVNCHLFSGAAGVRLLFLRGIDKAQDDGETQNPRRFIALPIYDSAQWE